MPIRSIRIEIRSLASLERSGSRCPLPSSDPPPSVALAAPTVKTCLLLPIKVTTSRPRATGRETSPGHNTEVEHEHQHERLLRGKMLFGLHVTEGSKEYLTKAWLHPVEIRRGSATNPRCMTGTLQHGYWLRDQAGPAGSCTDRGT